MLMELLERADLLDLANYIISNCKTRPAEYTRALHSIHKKPLDSYMVEDVTGFYELLTQTHDVPFDVIFEIATIGSAALHRIELVADAVEARYRHAMEASDYESLRRIDATLTFASFVQHYKPLVYGPTTNKRLNAVRRGVRALLTSLTQQTVLRTSVTEDNPAPPNVDLRVIFSVAWVPALPDTGAHLRQLSSYANALFLASAEAGQSCEIRVLFTFDHTTQYLFKQFQADSEDIRNTIESTLKTRVPAEFRKRLLVVFQNPVTRHTFNAHATNIAKSLNVFQPTHAIRWFGFYQGQYVGTAIYENAATLGIQFNAGNPVDGAADILLAHGDAPSPTLKLAGGDRWRPHRIPLDVFDVHKPVTPEDIGIKPEDRVFVSAMAGGRLDQALIGLTPEEAADIRKMFDQSPSARWFLVAIANEAAVRTARPEFEDLFERGQFVCFGLVDDVRAIIRHSAGYIQLPLMKGGGMAAAMAVAEAKPVIASAGTDAANLLPSNTVFQDWGRFASALETALIDAEAADALGRFQAKHLEDTHGLLAVGRELLTYFAEAKERFDVRKSLL